MDLPELEARLQGRLRPDPNQNQSVPCQALPTMAASSGTIR
jgi:hypothetical protein